MQFILYSNDYSEKDVEDFAKILSEVYRDSVIDVLAGKVYSTQLQRAENSGAIIVNLCKKAGYTKTSVVQMVASTPQKSANVLFAACDMYPSEKATNKFVEAFRLWALKRG